MGTINLKKGLFGYTASSVEEYIHALNAELLEKTNNLVSENAELKKRCERLENEFDSSNTSQDELLGKISSMSKEIKELIAEKESLNEQIERLKYRLAEEKKGRTNYEQGQSELADVMIEAKRFANDLREKTQIEYEEKRAANNDAIIREKIRLEKYISDIDEIGELLKKLCDDFGSEMKGKRADLNVILGNLNSFSHPHKKIVK